MKYKIIDKMDNLDARLDSIDKTLLRNTISLEEHIKRTAILEEELKPIKRHVDTVNTILKLASAGGAIAIAAKQLGLF